MNGNVTWIDQRTKTPALLGTVLNRHEHNGHMFLHVRWSNGRLATFVEGSEPPELRPAIDGDAQAVRMRGRLR